MLKDEISRETRTDFSARDYKEILSIHCIKKVFCMDFNVYITSCFLKKQSVFKIGGFSTLYLSASE